MLVILLFVYEGTYLRNTCYLLGGTRRNEEKQKVCAFV